MSDISAVQIGITKSPDYCIIGVHGTLGGIVPTGDILCDFYCNIPPLPQKICVHPSKDGAQEWQEIIEHSTPEQLRLVGTLMRPEVAYGYWCVATTSGPGGRL